MAQKIESWYRCQQCNEFFQPGQKERKRKYCSRSCRYKAFYYRKKHL